MKICVTIYKKDGVIIDKHLFEEKGYAYSYIIYKIYDIYNKKIIKNNFNYFLDNINEITDFVKNILKSKEILINFSDVSCKNNINRLKYLFDEYIIDERDINNDINVYKKYLSHKSLLL